MYIFKFIFIAILFFLITPSILIRIPAKGSKRMVAFVHSLIFAFVVGIVMCFWQPKPEWKSSVQEGLTLEQELELSISPSAAPAPVSTSMSVPASAQSRSINNSDTIATAISSVVSNVTSNNNIKSLITNLSTLGQLPASTPISTVVNSLKSM